MLIALALVAATFDVGIAAPEMPPLTTTLVVNSGDEASYNLSIEQGGDKSCAPGPAGSTRSIAVSLGLPDEQQADRFSVSLSWGRRVSGTLANCSDAQTRSTTINQTVNIAPRAVTTLAVDGGLTINLKRR